MAVKLLMLVWVIRRVLKPLDGRAFRSFSARVPSLTSRKLTYLSKVTLNQSSVFPLTSLSRFSTELGIQKNVKFYTSMSTEVMHYRTLWSPRKSTVLLEVYKERWPSINLVWKLSVSELEHSHTIPLNLTAILILYKKTGKISILIGAIMRQKSWKTWQQRNQNNLQLNGSVT